MVWLWPATQLVGALLMSYDAIQVGPLTVTFTAEVCVNQNWCSLIISASRIKEPPPDGAVMVTLTVALPLGATSAPRAKAWLVSQCDCCEEPPATVVKWRSRSTSV